MKVFPQQSVIVSGSTVKVIIGGYDGTRGDKIVVNPGGQMSYNSKEQHLHRIQRL